MIRLLGATLGWAARHVAVFVLIVLALWAAAKVYETYRSIPALRQEVAALEAQKDAVDRDASVQMAKARAAMERVDDLELAVLQQRRREVRAQITALRETGRSGAGLVLDAARGDGSAVARALGAGLRLQLLEREEAAIGARLQMIDGEERVRSLAAYAGALESRAAVLRRQIADIERRHPILSKAEGVAILQSLEGPWRELARARQDLRTVETRRQQAANALHAQAKAQQARAESFARARAAMMTVASPTAALQAEIDRKRSELSRHWGNRVWAALEPMLVPALWITFLVVLVPPATKAFWFFVVAPYASQLRPIVIRPELGGAVTWARQRPGEEENLPPGSGVSRRVVLLPGDELVVRPEYLQSSMNEARIDSTLVLSWAIPLGSLATGLIGLTRIRVGKREVATISATETMFDEVALVHVPAGAGLIFKPRNLVGVIHREDRAIAIRSTWRIGQLSAWLTLQFRFLVFEGPCTLIVKGARGVALEPSRNGRRIAGAATLGWSAGLAYSVGRSETFLAYLMGKQSLFNDSFEGEGGTVLYEEVPRRGSRGGLLGRGLEGLGDGLLKVLGL